MDLVKDAQLVAGVIKGNIDAFDALYYRYYKGVLLNIVKIVPHQAMAEDILQDVFVALWENRHSLDKDRSVAGWLFTVSRNKSIQHVKRLLKERPLADLSEEGADLPAPDSGSDPAEMQMNLLQDAINLLPSRKREAFQLCGLQGKSYYEASEIMGISVYTVQEYMKNSYKFIREYVGTQEMTYLVLFVITIW